MSDIQYNLQLEKLCNHLLLGEIVGVTEAISGGFLHRMYAIETTKGKYAIKALNPKVTGTINAIKRYADIICEIENWLNSEI